MLSWNLHLKTVQSRKAFWLWSYCQQNVPNLTPEQKKCLLKRAGNSNFLLRGKNWHLLLAIWPKVKIPSEINQPLSSLLAGSHHQFRKLLVRFSTKECFTNKFIDQFDGIFQTCHLIWIQGHLVRLHIFLNQAQNILLTIWGFFKTFILKTFRFNIFHLSLGAKIVSYIYSRLI